MQNIFISYRTTKEFSSFFYLGCAIQTYVKMYCYMYLRVGSPVPGEGVDVEKIITQYCEDQYSVLCTFVPGKVP